MTPRKRFLWIQAALLLAALGFPLYRYLTGLTPDFLSGCLFHDYLFLYCPLCGGTRAVSELLRLHLVSAFSYNALVVLLVGILLVADLIAWIRFLARREPILRIPRYTWVLLLILLFSYAILRNYLMIAYGMDPLGDLVGFWNAIRGAG